MAPITLFISHSWEACKTDDLNELESLLNAGADFDFANLSVIACTPAPDNAMEAARAQISEAIRACQIFVCFARDAIDHSDMLIYELGAALYLAKPILAVQPLGSEETPALFSGHPDITLTPWDRAGLIAQMRAMADATPLHANLPVDAADAGPVPLEVARHCVQQAQALALTTPPEATPFTPALEGGARTPAAVLHVAPQQGAPTSPDGADPAPVDVSQSVWPGEAAGGPAPTPDEPTPDEPAPDGASQDDPSPVLYAEPLDWAAQQAQALLDADDDDPDMAEDDPDDAAIFAAFDDPPAQTSAVIAPPADAQDHTPPPPLSATDDGEPLTEPHHDVMATAPILAAEPSEPAPPLEPPLPPIDRTVALTPVAPSTPPESEAPQLVEATPLHEADGVAMLPIDAEEPQAEQPDIVEAEFQDAADADDGATEDDAPAPTRVSLYAPPSLDPLPPGAAASVDHGAFSTPTGAPAAEPVAARPRSTLPPTAPEATPRPRKTVNNFAPDSLDPPGASNEPPPWEDARFTTPTPPATSTEPPESADAPTPEAEPTAAAAEPPSPFAEVAARRREDAARAQDPSQRKAIWGPVKDYFRDKR